jgi:hypothetical protein
VFPVRYGLNIYVLFRRNSVFKLLIRFMQSIQNVTSRLCTQPSATSEMERYRKDRGCDNVLPGEGYSTPVEAMLDEYGAESSPVSFGPPRISHEFI